MDFFVLVGALDATAPRTTAAACLRHLAHHSAPPPRAMHVHVQLYHKAHPATPGLPCLQPVNAASCSRSRICSGAEIFRYGAKTAPERNFCSEQILLAGVGRVCSGAEFALERAFSLACRRPPLQCKATDGMTTTYKTLHNCCVTTQPFNICVTTSKPIGVSTSPVSSRRCSCRTSFPLIR